MIGSIRRECLEHIVIFNERHLRRVLASYVDYYQRTRTHLSLDKDCPDPRPIMPRRMGKVVAIPQVGRPASSLRTSRRLIRIRSLLNHRCVTANMPSADTLCIGGLWFSIKGPTVLPS